MNTVTGQSKRVEVDPDVQAVLEFLQDRVQACRLISVADGVAQMARLLWASFPQEPFVGVSLVSQAITHDSQQAASESAPV